MVEMKGEKFALICLNTIISFQNLTESISTEINCLSLETLASIYYMG